MAISNVGSVQDAYNAYAVQKTSKVEKIKTETKTPTEVKSETKGLGIKKSSYGKTVGEPKLSEAGQKYYEELKKKYHNMDFVLVSADQKEYAKANAAKFANPAKMVVLIDEDKIERMATDESFRKQYEGVIANATNGLSQMKAQMASTGANVKGYGMQVNDDGTSSFFAVLKKSSADQKARIEKKQAEKKAEKKAEAKRAEKKAKEERMEEARANRTDKNSKPDRTDEHANRKDKIDDWNDEDTVTITANSIEELMQKIGDFAQTDLANSVQTDAEKMLGQHIDFRG